MGKTPVAVKFNRQLSLKMKLTKCENVPQSNILDPFEQVMH